MERLCARHKFRSDWTTRPNQREETQRRKKGRDTRDGERAHVPLFACNMSYRLFSSPARLFSSTRRRRSSSSCFCTSSHSSLRRGGRGSGDDVDGSAAATVSPVAASMLPPDTNRDMTETRGELASVYGHEQPDWRTELYEYLSYCNYWARWLVGARVSAGKKFDVQQPTLTTARLSPPCTATLWPLFFYVSTK